VTRWVSHGVIMTGALPVAEMLMRQQQTLQQGRAESNKENASLPQSSRIHS
jgi:hypothetical protein